MRSMNVLAMVGVVLVFGSQAVGTTYTSVVGNKEWASNLTWGTPLATDYPQLAGDIANVYHKITYLRATGMPTGNAYVYPGGEICSAATGGPFALVNVHMEGGGINTFAGSWYAPVGQPLRSMYVEVDSYVTKGTATAGGAVGWSGAGQAVAMHGTADLTMTGVGTFYADVTSDFSGTYIIEPTANNVIFDMWGASGWLTGNFHIESGGNVHQSTTAAADVYHHTMSGEGAWTTRTSKKLTFGSGSILRPGDANAPDAAVFSLGLPAYDSPKFDFGAGSTVMIDVTSDTTYDQLVLNMPTTGTSANILDDALLQVNLYTPLVETTISNLVIWNSTNLVINGMYTLGDISYTNNTGWDSLSVVKSADSKQLLLSGHYSSVIPEPGTLLLVGTGVLGLLGYIRRRRMK